MAGEPSHDVRAFLFTDIEGSTRRWEQTGMDMPSALAQHDALLAGAVEDHGGRVFKHLGDGMAAVFATANAASASAVTAQRSLAKADWPPGCELRVRMAIHVGSTTQRGGDFFGSTVNRAARLVNAGHGGQILLSDSARGLLDPIDPDWVLTSQGSHHLRDLSAPMTIFQLHATGLPDTFAALRTLDTYPSNLPRHLPTFLGRGDVLAAISGDLRQLSLITIVGPAGIGKTRLAQQVAAEALPYHSAGVWFVDLSAARGIDDVVSAIAVATDVKLRSSESWTDAFAGEFASHDQVIVLDNCEQVVDGVAQVVARLLHLTSNSRFLATSRQPLGVPGETVHRVGGLHVSAAVELFCERAAAARGSRMLDVDEPALEELCKRLDGAPLAIELAAARARALSAGEILARLDERFRLLRSSGRSADRHQTLQEAISWSYELLPPSEQLLLDRLAVFAHGFDLEAVETVCAVDDLDRWAILDLLEGLVDKSFVVVESDGRRSRYRLLEMIADYASARLDDRNETSAMRDLHARYFVEWGRTIGKRTQGRDLRGGTNEILSDIDNLRRALEWMGERRWYQEMVELLRDLKVFYAALAHAEGLRHHEELLAVGDALEPKLRVEVLIGAARICVQAGAFRRSDALLDEAERFSEQIGVSWPADLIYLRAMIADMDGRPDDVIRYCSTMLSSPETKADTFLDLLVRIRMVSALVIVQPTEAVEFAADTLQRAIGVGSDLLVAAAELTVGLTHLVVTKRFNVAERAFRRTIEISGDALPSASVPARVGVAMLRLDSEPLEALRITAEALEIESEGEDEPVSRACCYDVAAAACGLLGDVTTSRILLNRAQRLRDSCGFGAWAWTWPARYQAREVLATAPKVEARGAEGQTARAELDGDAGTDDDEELTSSAALQLVQTAVERATSALGT